MAGAASPTEDVLYRRTVSPGGKVRYAAWGRHYASETLPNGHWLVSIEDNHSGYVRVEPEYATIEAALQEVQEAMLTAMSRACRSQPEPGPDLAQDQKAMEAYYAAGGRSGAVYRVNSLSAVIDAGIAVLREAAKNAVLREAAKKNV